jgi:hypothetical protein
MVLLEAKTVVFAVAAGKEISSNKYEFVPSLIQRLTIVATVVPCPCTSTKSTLVPFVELASTWVKPVVPTIFVRAVTAVFDTILAIPIIGAFGKIGDVAAGI